MSEKFPAPMFIADSLALDFLNSAGTQVDMQVEWIGSGAGLISWLLEANVLPASVIAELQKTAVPEEFDIVAVQARRLREWFRSFVTVHKGKPLKLSAVQELDPLNRVLMRDEGYGQIVALETSRRNAGRGQDGLPASGLGWSVQRRWRSPDALLYPIARSMARLVCDDDFKHVKVCEGDHCTLAFIDRTRGHARRWCSMSACGNRAKQAAHRGRALRTLK
jgi:predicted RNA-binding Zn ribbon-like protein